MRNLWVFFLRYYSFFLFLLLEVIAFTLIVRNNSYQHATVLNSANVISGDLYKLTSDVYGFINLGETNDSLVTENARLRNLLLNQVMDTVAIKGSINDTLQKLRFTYIEAKVVNNSVNRRNNYLTLNRGSRHGIRKNMGVVGTRGIIGIVKEVSDHYSTVISFLHKDSRISAKIGSTGDFGSLVWDGTDPRIASLRDIPTHVKLHVGDSILTTGFSSIFPENIMIGVVTRFAQNPGDNFFDIEVKLSTNFSTLQYVYVIEDKLSDERIKLEEANQ